MLTDPVLLLALGAGFMLLLIIMHVPVGVAMAVAGVVGYGLAVNFPAALSTIGIETRSALSSIDLATIPLFLLMGNLAARARLSRDIYDIANAFIGHWPGGLAISSIFGCAGFGALCGSSVATTATMSRVAMPEMRERGYAPELAAGSIAAGGCLGILIPPSIIMVIYAVLTQQFVLDLFVAGIVPGIVAVVLYSITIMIVVKRKPGMAPRSPSSSWAARGRSLLRGWRALTIIILVVGGLYSGIFTVLEAAAVGTGITFLFWLATNDSDRWAGLLQLMYETARTTGLIFMMVIGSHVFSYFLTISGGTEVIIDTVANSGMNRYGILLGIIALYILLGAIFDAMAAMVLTIPFVFPLIIQLGFDPIWWGIVNVMIIEIGMITPPIGMNVFVMQSTARDVPLSTIFKGILPFLFADVVRIGLLIAFPVLALFAVS